MSDLFAESAASNDYTAADIEVLEGLEAVRRRPGMYVGGADERAYHHLAAEILDNSMDEAVEGHADLILVEITADGFFQVRDNGRGIPIDPHPKNPKQSALEVILTTLHSGGKFSGKNTSPGAQLDIAIQPSLVAKLAWLGIQIERAVKCLDVIGHEFMQQVCNFILWCVEN